jgi:hypothetical protein
MPRRSTPIRSLPGVSLGRLTAPIPDLGATVGQAITVVREPNSEPYISIASYLPLDASVARVLIKNLSCIAWGYGLNKYSREEQARVLRRLARSR